MNEPPNPLGRLLDEVDELAENKGEREPVAVRDVLHRVHGRAYGPLLLLIGLFSISPATLLPGMNWLVASVTAIVSAQMILGAPHPWLPRRALDARMKASEIRRTLTGAKPWARRLDYWLRPRLTFMTRPPFLNFAGVLCLIAALATFPLGLIPAGPVAPGLAITFVGLALMASDGLLLLLGGALTLAAVALVTMAFS